MALPPKCDEQPYRLPAISQKAKGRYSRKEFAQFLYRARGSLLELETQLFIAKELHCLEPLVFRRMEDRTKELGRILNGLRNSVLEGINVAS
jgi:four helix bundle protein